MDENYMIPKPYTPKINHVFQAKGQDRSYLKILDSAGLGFSEPENPTRTQGTYFPKPESIRTQTNVKISKLDRTQNFIKDQNTKSKLCQKWFILSTFQAQNLLNPKTQPEGFSQIQLIQTRKSAKSSKPVEPKFEVN